MTMGVLGKLRAVAQSKAAQEFEEYDPWATQDSASAIEKERRARDFRPNEALLGLVKELRRDGMESAPVRHAMTSLSDRLAIAQHYLGDGRYRDQLTAYSPTLRDRSIDFLSSVF